MSRNDHKQAEGKHDRLEWKQEMYVGMGICKDVPDVVRVGAMSAARQSSFIPTNTSQMIKEAPENERGTRDFE